MKIKEIIEILSPRERIRFEIVINKPETSRLYILFHHLNKSEMEKSFLFEQLFGRAHSQQEDYLLRNELRLLTIALNDFLIKEARKKAVKGNDKKKYNFEEGLILLRVYLQRQAFSLFVQEWKKAEKFAQQGQQWAVLFALTRIKAEYEQLSDELHPDAFAQLRQLLDKSPTYIVKAAEEQKAELNMLTALTNRYLRILGGQTPDATTEESSNDKQAEPIIEFFTAIAESHNARTAAERLPIFLRAQSQQAQVLLLRPQLITAFIALNNNIGLEYFLLRQFAQAAPYFDTALDLLDKQDGYLRAWDVRFNAYSNLLFWGKYSIAVDFHRRRPDFLAKLPKRLYYRFHYLVAVAYLFARDGTTALDLLNSLPLFQRPNSDYYYARLLFACAYSSLEDWESASRELRNIAQAERKRINPNEQTRIMATYLKQWVSFQQTAHSRQEGEDFKHKLHKTIEEKINASPQNDSLPMRWLAFQLQPHNTL